MVGVDLAESMQARALSKARAQELENIKFQQVQRPGSALCWPVLALFLKHTDWFTPGHFALEDYFKDADYLTPEGESLTWLQKRVHG